jgi:hypothetical protein
MYKTRSINETIKQVFFLVIYKNQLFKRNSIYLITNSFIFNSAFTLLLVFNGNRLHRILIA